MVGSSSEVNCVDKDGNTTRSYCYSVPSQKVTVFKDPHATSTNPSLVAPLIDLGGDFCEGSTKLLKVTNSNDNPANATYTWYADNTEIGTGAQIVYSVPTGIQKVIIRCRATRPDECAVESSWNESTIGAGSLVPAKPVISGDKALCEGEATLYILPMDTPDPDAPDVPLSFAWYKDGKKIENADKQLLDIDEGGDYYATYSRGGCSSPMAHINIPFEASVYPEISITPSNPTTGGTGMQHLHVANGDAITFNAKDEYGKIKNYKWTVSSGATITSGGTGYDFATVKFTGSGGAMMTVTVEGSNDCGPDEAKADVMIADVCTTSIDNVSPSGNTSVSAIKDRLVTLTVSASLSDKSTTESYQWYKSTTLINSPAGGELIPDAVRKLYIAPTTSVGTTYYYCVVSTCKGSKTSGVYKVTVSGAMPTTIGAGIFTGLTSFDINYTNYPEGSACGTKESRNNRKADFNKRDRQDPAGTDPITLPYSGVQVYTFKPV